MRRKRTLAIALAAGVLAVAGGAGIAQAVSGSDDEPVTGPAAERAADAALAAIGGGTVLEVERQDGDGAGVYEVEVRREDGSEVEIHLDAQFREVGTAADDDGAESEDDGSDD